MWTKLYQKVRPGNHIFFSVCPFPNGYVCLCWICFFIIINICLHWGQFGQENRRKNQGLLTTRSPCDTTFHSIKEVKVLLPWVWFTRKKEREKVVMLLRYWERHVREQGTTTPGTAETLIQQTHCSLKSAMPLSPGSRSQTCFPTCAPGGYEARGKIKAYV